MNVLVIHETDSSDKEEDVIGVADSVDNAEKIISEYYGKHEVVSFIDIRDGDLEYSKVIRADSSKCKREEYTITLQWFNLNKA